MKKYVALAALALTSTTTLANDLYLDFSGDVFHARIDANNSHSGLGYLAEAIITDHDISAYNVGLMKTGKVRDQDIDGGLGAKFVYLDGKNENYYALTLGGSISFPLPLAPDVRVVTELFYAPSATISDDLDNLIDFTLRMEYQVFENGSVYAGGRLLQIEDQYDNETEVDDDVFIGIKLSF